MSNLKKIKADLHIHTLLSPCADNDMTPVNIVYMAVAQDLSLIAITDHNSVQNAGAVIDAAKKREDDFLKLVGHKLVVLPGMEVTTKEEVHVLCIFDVLENALDWQAIVFDNMPNLKNNPALWGQQSIYCSEDKFLRYEEKWLSAATNLNLTQVFETVFSLGGICIPAHIDKEFGGLQGVLGLVPEDVNVVSLEISPRYDRSDFRKVFKDLSSYPLVTFSDAHQLGEIGTKFTEMTIMDPSIKDPSIRELLMVFAGRNGRSLGGSQ
jgi:PHP family Zn ribbon phosphoesterase